MNGVTVTIGGVDYTSALTNYERTVDICNVLCQVTLSFVPGVPYFNPYSEVTIDYDGARRFTGYVSSTKMTRGGGQWEMHVICDHKAIKRLKDYWFDGDVATQTGFFAEDPRESCTNFLARLSSAVGATITFNSTYDPDMPYYVWSRPVNAFQIFDDTLTFASAQPIPNEDGSISVSQVAISGSLATDISPSLTECRRTTSDAFFRTGAIVYGAEGETYFSSGSLQPYGYTRTAIVANPLIRNMTGSSNLADALVNEYNRIVDVQNTTVPQLYPVNVGDTIRITDSRDSYDQYGLVTTMSEFHSNDRGMVTEYITNQHCPRIFGFDQAGHIPEEYWDCVVVLTRKHLALSLDFFTSGSPHWTDITPSAVAGHDNNMRSFAVNTTGEICLTVSTGIGGGLGGVYYCSYLPTAKPSSWSLAADDSIITADWTGDFNAICVSGGGFLLVLSGNNYPVPTWGMKEWYITSGSITRAIVVPNVPTGKGANSLYTAYQFAVPYRYTTSVERIGMGASYTTGGQVTSVGSTMCWNYEKWGWDPPSHTDKFDGVLVCAEDYCITDHHNIVKYKTVSGYEYDVYDTDADTLHPLIEMDDHKYWTRYSDKVLMIDHSIQAVPHDLYGATGVFGPYSGNLGGAYDCVYGYGEIIWVADTPKGTPAQTIRSIAHTTNGGVDWLTKDGDYDTAVGAYAGGFSNWCSLVKFVPVKKVV